MKFGKFSGQQTTPTQQLLVQLRNTVDAGRMVSPESAKTMFALESAQDFQLNALNTAHEGLSTAIESIAAELGFGAKLTAAQIAAGSIGGLIAADPRHLLSRKSLAGVVATEGAVVVQTMGAADGMMDRAFGLEAYDERENKNASIYSIAYNMQSARQDEFGETFFPTLVLTPDQVGFGVTVDLMTVFDAVQHNVDGTFRDFAKKNIIRAVADHTVLKKEQTRVIPAVRPQNVAQFVDAAVVAPAAVIVEGQSITTAPLKIGKELNLIAVGQTDTLLSTGVMDNTDTLDTFLNLKNVYVKFGADVLRFNVSNLPLANFTYATQNNYRVMQLNFETTSVLINNTTKQADGSPLVDLAAIVTGNMIARVELKLTGSVNIETGKTSVYGNAVATHVVLNSAGQQLDKAVAPAAPVAPAASNDITPCLACKNCHFARFCSPECLESHKEIECFGILNNPVIQIIESFVKRCEQTSFFQMIQKALNLEKPTKEQEALLGSCWMTAFALLRFVTGYEGIDALMSHRNNMETMLIAQDWNASDNEELRENCMERCSIISKIANPVPLIGWILPGENFMKNSPYRQIQLSYEHAFAVIPLYTKNQEGVIEPTENAVLVHSFGKDTSATDAIDEKGPKNMLKIALINKKVFWIALRAFIASKVWSNSVASCFERAFGVKKSFDGRTIHPVFDAIPFVPPKCVNCGKITPPTPCSRCLSAVYCSVACQKADWPKHREICKDAKQDEK